MLNLHKSVHFIPQTVTLTSFGFPTLATSYLDVLILRPENGDNKSKKTINSLIEYNDKQKRRVVSVSILIKNLDMKNEQGI